MRKCLRKQIPTPNRRTRVAPGVVVPPGRPRTSLWIRGGVASSPGAIGGPVAITGAKSGREYRENSRGVALGLRSSRMFIPSRRQKETPSVPWGDDMLFSIPDISSPARREILRAMKTTPWASRALYGRGREEPEG